MNGRVLAGCAAFLVAAAPIAARAGGFSATLSGELLNSFNATTCGDQLGDTYDTFCPSGQCRCEEYGGRISGNRVGTGPEAVLHVTVDAGDATSSPGCSPWFGELIFSASKDDETIFLNGSYCEPFAPSSKKAQSLLRGGFGVAQSGHGVAAFGTVQGTIGFNTVAFKLKLTGRTP